MTRRNDEFRSHGEETAPGQEAAAQSNLSEAKVHEIVNGAMKRFTTQDLPKHFEGLTTQLGTITETLARLSETNSNSSQGVQEEGKGKKGSEGLSPEVNARIQQLEKDNKKAQERLEAGEKLRQDAENRALKTDQESKVRALLNGFQFVTDDAREDAFTLVNGMVQRDGEGNLIANELPLDVFVKDYIPSKKAHFLAPVGKGGSGANGGQQRGGAAPFSIESIKPGMSKEDLVRAASQIRAAMQPGS